MTEIVGQVGGNYYDKYNSRNPIVKNLMNEFLTSTYEMVDISGANTVYEIGCGEGEISLRLKNRGIGVSGSDISNECVEVSNSLFRQSGYASSFHQANIQDLQTTDLAGAELVICMEVFEHLDDPLNALALLNEIVDGYLLLSVPREPIWRMLNVMRGKYIMECGNTPGHVQHWTARQFYDFVAEKFEIVEVKTPLPWTMILAKSRKQRLL